MAAPVIRITNVDEYYGRGAAAMVIDPAITLTASTRIYTANILISGGFRLGDKLRFTNN